MSLRNLIFGTPQVKPATEKDEKYTRDDERLRRLEAKREEMRENLSRALNEIIKGSS